MFSNKQNLIILSIIPVIISIPFLEFLAFNLNIINEEQIFN